MKYCCTLLRRVTKLSPVVHFFKFCTQHALAEEADAAQVAAGGNPFDIGSSTNVLCK
jgi:hypothetical protein